ncbi:hypothetical protein Q9233_017874 [Columba guinea]|nr:hypothetical protein Q9233_017874 [Columba guinea]
MAREEGIGTLWRGCIPTMARAVVVNAAQLASYSQSKQFLLETGRFRDDILCHFCASMISGLVTTAASMPVDIVKTRWGFTPYYARLGPHTVLTFIFLEQLNRAYGRLFLTP